MGSDMDGGDRGDDRTFRVNFTSEGVARLRETVNEKLKEFMGDYTDETLVEYVIVLLKNGRSKEEAKNELNVFLGDDSDSFISWLWEHLGSNLYLYVPSRGAEPDVVAKEKAAAQEPAVKINSQLVESESEKEKSNKLSKTRHRREWKGLGGDAEDPTNLKIPVVDSNRTVEDSHRTVDRVKRSSSPRRATQRKRSLPEEYPLDKRESVSQATIAAPRRLLQFAVRDAVATSRPSNLMTEPSVKRLRSVVSTAPEDSSLEDHRQRTRSVARLSNTMATAIRAVAEAAKDVQKVKPSRNVFDRLGSTADVSDMPNQHTEFGEAFAGARRDQTYSEIREDHSSHRNKIEKRGEYVSDVPLSLRDSEMASDPGSDHEGYDDVNFRGRGGVDASQIGTFAGREVDGSLTFPLNLANSSDRRVQKALNDQVPQVSVPDTSSKILKTSATMNTPKALQYLEARETVQLDSQKSVSKSKLVASKSNVQLLKEKKESAVLANVKPETDILKEPQKIQLTTPGLYSTGPLIEDADSRTIFVNNVHFGATKDSLCRHFNNFGEVLKVTILTDPATGLPKGSAYVEFMRKEAAEHALSLDGTSFMSRILKVVKKSSAPPEAAPSLTWPRTARAFTYPVSGFGMMPYPRGVPNIYRARPTVKPGGRSLQWKRDSQYNSTQISHPAGNTFQSAVPRGLTYVRSEAKMNGSSSNA